jgi:DNA-binding GntR family transcriptional regulator
LDFLMQRNVPSQSARARDPCGDSQLWNIALLAIQRGDVLLCFEALLYSTTGKVIDYSFSYFHPVISAFTWFAGQARQSFHTKFLAKYA